MGQHGDVQHAWYPFKINIFGVQGVHVPFDRVTGPRLARADVFTGQSKSVGRQQRYGFWRRPAARYIDKYSPPSTLACEQSPSHNQMLKLQLQTAAPAGPSPQLSKHVMGSARASSRCCNQTFEHLRLTSSFIPRRCSLPREQISFRSTCNNLRTTSNTCQRCAHWLRWVALLTTEELGD